jgi:hypothetical protein
MVNRLNRDGRDWVSSDLPWRPGTRSWRCQADPVFLKVHSTGRKVSGPGLWRWEASHRHGGWARFDGEADTREAAMDAAVVAILAVRETYDGLAGPLQDDNRRRTIDP